MSLGYHDGFKAKSFGGRFRPAHPIPKPHVFRAQALPSVARLPSLVHSAGDFPLRNYAFRRITHR